MRRFTIMGFTEAELGFVLAALFVAVAITAIHERDVSAADAENHEMVSAERDSLRSERDSLRSERDSLATEVARLRDSIAPVALLRDSIAALEAKISTKVPQCWEKGESSAAIAELDVIGATRYTLRGDTVTMDEIRQRLASFIARGSELGCRFVVRARPTAGVNALEQSAAVWRLRQYFDVNDRPR
jgi:hypothetical protein